MFRERLQLSSWLDSKKRTACYAALALVAIQVAIGIIMKESQTSGDYAFSASASITISEFLKLLISTTLFYRECRKRVSKSSMSDPPEAFEAFLPSSASSSRKSSESSVEQTSSEEKASYESSDEVESQSMLRSLGPPSFWRHCREDLSTETRYGFAQLALFYALINNTTFVAYKLADPGTIMLTRSGVTFVTALTSICLLRSQIAKIQWMAILIQIFGLIVTQYQPQIGTSYPLSTYAILVFQLFLTSISGVYNQALLSVDEKPSLHASNMLLYGCGVLVNALIHITIQIFKADEPGFFVGFDSVGVLLVVGSNVIIGLVITAVYKYADAVIKCLATAVSTGILLFVSPIFFGTTSSPLVFPGALIVLIASWLYMEAAVPCARSVQAKAVRSTSKSKVSGCASKFRGVVLLVSAIVTTTAVSYLHISCRALPDFHSWNSDKNSPEVNHVDKAQTSSASSLFSATLKSPFANTLGFVRWNSEHPERMPITRKYEPFFHTLHFSMPRYIKDPSLPVGYHNLTHDSWENGYMVYMQVAKTMQHVLDNEPEISGLMYFHFDAWIDPLDFEGENFNNIWIPELADFSGESVGPALECMEDRAKYSHWFPFDDNHMWHDNALRAVKALGHFELDYVVNDKEWCVGWSDIYYIPRRYFADYIFLSSVFGGFQTFHEIAIPTMMHIIDKSRREHPMRSIWSRFGNCWGSCCMHNPDMHDLMFHRCGHKLNFANPNQTLVDAHFDRVDREVEMLGMPLVRPSWQVKLEQEDAGNTSPSEKFISESTFVALNILPDVVVLDDSSGQAAIITKERILEAIKDLGKLGKNLLSNMAKGGGA